MSGQPYKRPDSSLHELSASRIRTVDTCGLKFRYQYVDKIPASSEIAAVLFGNVVHDGVDVWYGPSGDGFKTTSLRQCFHDKWVEYLPKNIWNALERCLALDQELEASAQAILLLRPELKSPRTTKAFLESSTNKLFEDQREELLKRCGAQDGIKWPAHENPIQGYRKSMEIADQMQALWQPLRRPIAVEYPFRLEFEGFSLRGRIDQVRNDPDANGQVLNELLDIKTGRQLMSQMEAFVQAFIYDEACYQDEALPTPDHVTFWMARFNKAQHGRIDRARHRKMAQGILNSVARRIITADYQPNYGMHCKMCDFKGLCEQEISLWPAGSDSLVLEPA